MVVHAKSKYLRLSASKAMPLARRLKGMPVDDAIDLAGAQNTKAARFIAKTLRSAVANAKQKEEGQTRLFKVKNILIETGPSIKRFWPRSRGMVRAVKRRTSHVNVAITDE